MKQNRTTLRAIQILDLLSTSENGLTLSEIAEHLDIPKTSAFTILQTLKSVHMLRQENKRFSIGFQAYKIGCAYIRGKEVYSVAKESLMQLAEELKLAVSLVLYEDGALNYVYQYNPDSSFINKPEPVDTSDCTHAAASGKIILAYLDEKEREDVLGKLEYKRFTANTITDRETLEKEIELTRTRGYALDDEEYLEHFFCISIPILSNDQLVAAVSFSGLTIFNEKKETFIPKIVALGQRLSEEMADKSV